MIDKKLTVFFLIELSFYFLIFFFFLKIQYWLLSLVHDHRIIRKQMCKLVFKQIPLKLNTFYIAFPRILIAMLNFYVYMLRIYFPKHAIKLCNKTKFSLEHKIVRYAAINTKKILHAPQR